METIPAADGRVSTEATTAPAAEAGHAAAAAGEQVAGASSPRLGGGPVDDDQARLLFRYIGGDEWREYRSIVGVLAGTFFSEFSPGDVAAALRERGVSLDIATVEARLESLRQWGNIAVSSSVGNPTSLDDYYRRRHRYLITRHGQEVHDLVEGILTSIDEVGDLQSGRLRDLRRGLQRLVDQVEQGDAAVTDHDDLADAVRSIFDAHQAFTTEITQFFAALNQWQSRYDLEPEQVQFFAQVLVGYVSDQLGEIRTLSRPIARLLDRLRPHLGTIIDRADIGLARRVDDAGLGETIAVRRSIGSSLDDWDRLRQWFSAPSTGRSRLDELMRQALAAVNTLTTNLTRISRAGGRSASRRADFLRLAGWFDEAADVDETHLLAAAAFGLFPARHFAMPASDADDPLPASTSWCGDDAPRAVVPVAVRERGEATMRGRPSPIRDRSRERELLRWERQARVDAARRAAAEVLDAAAPDGRLGRVDLSQAAFDLVRDLVARAASLRVGIAARRTATDGNITCAVARDAGATTIIACPLGELTLHNTEVWVHRAHTTGSQDTRDESNVAVDGSNDGHVAERHASPRSADLGVGTGRGASTP